MFLGYRPDSFPLFLKFGESVGSSFPVSAVFQGFRFLTQCFFLFQIFVHSFFQALEEFSFFLEEVITRMTETFEYLHIHLLRCKTDCFPFVLQCNYFLSLVFPSRECFQFIIFYRFYDFADNGFLV